MAETGEGTHKFQPRIVNAPTEIYNSHAGIVNSMVRIADFDLGIVNSGLRIVSLAQEISSRRIVSADSAPHRGDSTPQKEDSVAAKGN